MPKIQEIHRRNANKYDISNGSFYFFVFYFINFSKENISNEFYQFSLYYRLIEKSSWTGLKAQND